MNDDLEMLADDFEDEGLMDEPAVEEAPQYMTKDEFSSQMKEFQESLLAGLGNRNQPQAPTAPGEEKFFDGWEPDTATDVQRYVASEVAKVHQMYAPVVASSEADKVVAALASDAPVATQKYVAGLVNKMGLSPTQIRQLAENQEGIDYIQTLAAGHSARQAKMAPILRSNDPGGSRADDFQIPASQRSNMEEFVQSMSQFMPRKEAERTFKQRVKAGVN